MSKRGNVTNLRDELELYMGVYSLVNFFAACHSTENIKQKFINYKAKNKCVDQNLNNIGSNQC